jgi:DNA-binding NarL/FixJ family response regulator
VTTGQDELTSQDRDALALIVVGLAARQAVRDLHPLTPRERDVLTLIVTGLTARQAARRLHLSPRTVEHHIQRVMGRLGIRNRAALVRYLTENNIV